MSYPYAEHDNGVVLTQPRPGEFERRPMTAGELAAREPALKIAKDIYRHANQAGVCYYEFWRLIADAIDACALPEAARIEGEITHRWSGPYHDRLEYLLDGRPLTMEEVKGMLKAVCVPSQLARRQEEKS